MEVEVRRIFFWVFEFFFMDNFYSWLLEFFVKLFIYVKEDLVIFVLEKGEERVTGRSGFLVRFLG